MKRNGITLLEVLFIVAILGILAALFLPAVRTAGEASRRTTCANNLKQFGLGIHNYHDTFKVLPPASTGFDTPPRVSWQVRILPFCEQVPLYDRVNFKALDSGLAPLTGRSSATSERMQEKLQRASNNQVPYSLCPTDPRANFVDQWAQTSYSGSLGMQRTAFQTDACSPYAFPNRHYSMKHGSALFGDTDSMDDLSGMFSRQFPGPLTLGDMKDGTSNTFMTGEILGDCHPNQKGWWSWNGAGNAHASTSVPLNVLTTCVDSYDEAESKGYLHPECFAKSNTNLSWGFRSYHPNGANFLMGDGSVQFINNDINYDIYQAYGGRNDALPVKE